MYIYIGGYQGSFMACIRLPITDLNCTGLNDDRTCKKCNMIINNIIDSPEWKNYKNSSGNPTRCGMPVNELLPQSSLGTNISSRGISEKMKKVDRYQKWNSMPYKERSLYKVYKEIELKCSLNDLYYYHNM